MEDYLLDELRRHKAEVITALNTQSPTGIRTGAPRYSKIVSGEERYPYNFVGDRVPFLLNGSVEGCLATKGTVFAQGEVVGQKWLGYTAMGNIPEYEVQIKTDDKQVHTRRLVEDYVSEVRHYKGDTN